MPDGVKILNDIWSNYFERPRDDPDEWYITLRHYWIALRTNATPMLEKGLAKKKLPSREMVAVSSNEHRIAEAEDPEIWKDAIEKLDEAAEKSE